MQNNSREIYEILRSIPEGQSYLKEPDINQAINRFEEAIMCLLDGKLNPSLPYNIQLIISNLIDILKNDSNKLRTSQIASIMAIVDYIANGKTKGLIKLPTGAGKTRLFTEMVNSLNLPTLILVPKNNLKKQTYDYFEGENVFKIGENGTATQDTRNTINKIKANNITNPIIIITYQSFTRIKADTELFKEFSSVIKLVIRDEAHRSLGDKTTQALQDFTEVSQDEENDEILSQQDYDLLELDIADSKEKIELLFTATPNLLDKSVRDTYEYIFSLTLQDLVSELVLHFPKFIHISEAKINIGDKNLGEKLLNDFALKFVNENKTPIYEELIEKYIELKNENNGYLPGVGFCRDIKHAEFITEQLKSRGIRAIRVTSSNSEYDGGVDEDTAKEMINTNKADMVITVTKVAEGWDVPTLRCAVNFSPTLSEAKYIQGAGRVFRTFDYEKDKIENEKIGVLPKNIAYIIEPKFWNIIGSNSEGEGEGKGLDGSDGEGEGEGTKNNKIIKISGITHFINSGEFEIDYLESNFGDISEFNEKISEEEVIKFFKEKDFDYWINLKLRQIREIEYRGKGIIALSNLTGRNNPNNVNIINPSGFKEFIGFIFGKELNNITQEEVIKFFKEKEFEYWNGLNVKQIREIKYKGKGIKSLSTLTGWNNPNNLDIQTPSLFQEFISFVFGKEIKIKEEITKEEVIKFFKEKDFDYWINLTAKQINEIEYKGKNIKAISTLSLWDNPNKVNVKNLNGFEEFISFVFGKEIKIQEEITQEEVIKFFKEKDFEYWINLTRKQINEIKYKGKCIIALSNLTGWNNPNNIKVQTPSGFQEFISFVFGKKLNKITQEEVIKFFKENGFDYWIGLNKKQIKEIKYKGKSITSLSTLSLWNNPNKISIENPSGFQEFISFVFGKEIKIKEEITQEEVIRFFKEKNFDYWINLTAKQISEIKYKRKKIKALSTLTGWNNTNKVNVLNPSGLQEFIKWLYKNN